MHVKQVRQAYTGVRFLGLPLSGNGKIENMEGGKMEKINKLLRDSGKEHKKIADAAGALLRGEITGEEFQEISDEALKRVDVLLDAYNSEN